MVKSSSRPQLARLPFVLCHPKADSLKALGLACYRGLKGFMVLEAKAAGHFTIASFGRMLSSC